MKKFNMKSIAILTAALSTNAFAFSATDTNAISSEIFENRSEYKCSSHLVESAIYSEISLCVKADSEEFVSYVTNWKASLKRQHNLNAEEIIANQHFNSSVDSVVSLKDRNGQYLTIVNNKVVKTENDHSLFNALKLYFSNQSLLNNVSIKENLAVLNTNERKSSQNL
ncbi:hypothetical protein LMH73_014695 [Vibrio splendidus]|nr:hypothetical protein [Vibrio splendidus]MCC4882922.1 hypothetical protein [Vibrio splendidus]